MESGNLDSILELRADGKGSVGSWLTLSAYLQFAQRSHLLKITFCYSHLLKIWSVHIRNRGMKPSHLAGSFEYLYMFWLHRPLPAKKALNSKLTAKWLGFISRSQIRTNHILKYLHKVIYTYLFQLFIIFLFGPFKTEI